MKNKAKVAIVCPYYRQLTKEETISYNHLQKYLKSYDRFLVIPDKLNPQDITINNEFQIMKFPSYWFQNVRSYSELVSTKQFYQSFIDYDFILIYQFDALVFSDKLQYWCDQDYDYIGAPALSKIGFLTHAQSQPSFIMNGGLSLRKVKSMLTVIDIAEQSITRKSDNKRERLLWFIQAIVSLRSHQDWLKAPITNYPFNEDGFWSFEAIKYYSKFKLPDFATALKFAFELNPRESFEKNNSDIPFACHAWAKYDKDFWQTYLQKE